MPSNVVASERSEFRNVSGHVIGVVTRRDNNNMKSLALMPDDSIWLDEEEQIATANAPRFDEDNPFENGDLELVTKAKQILNRRRIGYTEQPQVLASEASDAEPPEEGTEGEPDAEEESDPAGSGGSPEEAPTAPPEGQGDDDPPVPQKVKSPQRPDSPMDEAQEANAKAHAARAVAAPAADAAPAKLVPAKATATPAPEKPAVEKPAVAPQGKRAPTEEIATPEAEGK